MLKEVNKVQYDTKQRQGLNRRQLFSIGLMDCVSQVYILKVTLFTIQMDANLLVTERLQKMRDTNGKESLFDHLSQLAPLLEDFQKDKISPIANFQYISEYLKKNRFSSSEPRDEAEIKAFISQKTQYPRWLAQSEKIIASTAADFTERIVGNFEQQSQRLFGKVGIGLGKEESLRIYQGMKRLASSKQVSRLRFWGKILTRGSDYLILEGSCKQPKPEEIAGDTQKTKEGANYNTYWVATSSLSQEWQELPLVTPEQIRTARLIKYVFTGELDSPVVSSPPFKGKEKHLLKAQIVRITHNCEIAPKGLYAPLEDNPDEVDFAEQFKMPDFAELSNLENWVHFNPYILKLGRSTYYVDPKVAEQQKEELLAKLGETDPKIERLKAINEDKGLQKFGLEGCWNARVYGSSQLFNNVGKEEGSTSCYAVVSLRNPHWPGWVTVASNKQFGSIYMGYGLKSSQPPFSPLSPDDIALQAEDVEECHEPNPKDPPDELQPDSDDENKKPEE